LTAFVRQGKRWHIAQAEMRNSTLDFMEYHPQCMFFQVEYV